MAEGDARTASSTANAIGVGVGSTKTRGWVTTRRNPLATTDGMPSGSRDRSAAVSQLRTRSCRGASIRCASTRTLTSTSRIDADPVVHEVAQRSGVGEVDAWHGSGPSEDREIRDRDGFRRSGPQCGANGFLDQLTDRDATARGRGLRPSVEVVVHPHRRPHRRHLSITSRCFVITDGCDVGSYIAGLTKPQTGTGNPEGYKARQEQRRFERQVRKWKRREAVAMDDHAAKAARVKVQAWQSRLKAHVDSHDLFRQPERERLRMRGATPTPGSPSIARTHLRSEINPSSVRGRQVTQALDAVEGVHRLPDMRDVTIIRGNGLPAETRGFYRRRTGTVALNPTGDATSTLIHELGHVLEHRTGGGIGSVFASNPALRAAVEATPEVQRLRAMLSAPGPGSSTTHLKYLLEDGEVWARAYSQYIAQASNNQRLRMDLKRVAGLPSGRADRYRQWSDESFQSIAPLVRDVLKDWGLL